MSFSGDIRKSNMRTMRKIDMVTRRSFIEVGRRIVKRSPVGQPGKWKSKAPKGYTGGRFRANWQAGANLSDGEVNGTDVSLSTSAILDAANKHRTGRGMYLFNNLPYAKRLEDGWSKQAPAGMVKITVGEWPSIVDLQASMVR